MWREEEEEDEELVEVLLRGRAPWGFTLRGGSEHRETLVITKVKPTSSYSYLHVAAPKPKAVCLVSPWQRRASNPNIIEAGTREYFWHLCWKNKKYSTLCHPSF